MTKTEAIATYTARRIEALTEQLRVAANERDGFTYSPRALARAASSPAGIVGR